MRSRPETLSKVIEMAMRSDEGHTKTREAIRRRKSLVISLLDWKGPLLRPKVYKNLLLNSHYQLDGCPDYRYTCGFSVVRTIGMNLAT